MTDTDPLAFFRGLPDVPADELAADAQPRTFESGEFIVRQHDEANAVQILVEGSVQFLLRFEGVDDLVVGHTQAPGALLGWSAFRPPFRYTASVRCETRCRTVRFSRQCLDELIDRHPAFGYALLTRVARALADRLEDGRDRLVHPPWLARRLHEGLQGP